MPQRRFRTNWQFPPFLQRIGRDWNRLFAFANGVTGKSEIEVYDTGESIGIRFRRTYGRPVLHVKVTGAKSGDYYPGDVYASGVETTATASNVDLYFPDFEVDTTASDYGYFPAVRVDNESAGTTVYQVVGLDTPPLKTTGYWFPVNHAGTHKWLEGGPC